MTPAVNINFRPHDLGDFKVIPKVSTKNIPNTMQILYIKHFEVDDLIVS
jgi:hypothetical protein